MSKALEATFSRRKDVQRIDEKLPSGSIRHWSEFYLVRTQHKNRVFSQGFVPVTCGGCPLKRPVRIEYVRRDGYDGRCPKCRPKKYSRNIVLSTGSIIHSTELQENRVPVTCAKCVEKGNPNAKRLVSRKCLSTPGYTGYCQACGYDSRSGDEAHPSDAIVHWSEPQLGVSRKKQRFAFTCSDCNHKNFSGATTMRNPNWLGLCAECRRGRGSPKKYTSDKTNSHGTITRFSVEVGGMIPVLYKECLHEMLSTRVSAVANWDTFSKICPDCRRDPVAFATRIKELDRLDFRDSSGQKKRPRGRQLGDRFLNPERVKADLESVIIKLSARLPEHKIKRALIAKEFHRRGENIDASTVTKRVQMVYGKKTSVADVVAWVLNAQREIKSRLFDRTFFFSSYCID